jgi:hypothetical protein
MRNFILVSFILLIAASAFGHAGEIHKYMGTVTTLHDDGSFIVKKTDGTTMHVEVSQATAYQHADGRQAKAADLVSGARVVVTIGKDGKTATLVKLARTSGR